MDPVILIVVVAVVVIVIANKINKKNKLEKAAEIGSNIYNNIMTGANDLLRIYLRLIFLVVP